MLTKTKSSVANGTCLQGYIDISYDELVAKFGEPSETYSANEKVQAEWVLNDSGCVVTIYDYKSNVPPQKNRDWHIGGHGKLAVKLVKDTFPTHSVS